MKVIKQETRKTTKLHAFLHISDYIFLSEGISHHWNSHLLQINNLMLNIKTINLI